MSPRRGAIRLWRTRRASTRTAVIWDELSAHSPLAAALPSSEPVEHCVHDVPGGPAELITSAKSPAGDCRLVRRACQACGDGMDVATTGLAFTPEEVGVSQECVTRFARRDPPRVSAVVCTGSPERRSDSVLHACCGRKPDGHRVLVRRRQEEPPRLRRLRLSMRVSPAHNGQLAEAVISPRTRVHRASLPPRHRSSGAILRASIGRTSSTDITLHLDLLHQN